MGQTDGRIAGREAEWMIDARDRGRRRRRGWRRSRTVCRRWRARYCGTTRVLARDNAAHTTHRRLRLMNNTSHDARTYSIRDPLDCIPDTPIANPRLLDLPLTSADRRISLLCLICILPSVLWCCWLGGRKGIRPVKKLWVVGCWRGCVSGARLDLHMAQLMPLPLTLSCFSKIQIGFTFLVPAHLGSPRQRAVKRACVCVCLICIILH